MDNGFLPKAGGFRKLKAYVLAEAIFDLTAVFVRRFVPSKSRTCDQMEQAARSGKQNIAEGSMASATSKETEIKLTNVAKASLEELKVDYDDYLRRNNLPLWEADYERQMKLKEYLRDLLGTCAGAITYALLYLGKTFLKGVIVSGLTADAALIATAAKLPATTFNMAVAIVVAPILAKAIRKALEQNHISLN